MSSLPEPRRADLGIPGVTIDGTGLRLSAEIEFADWEKIGLHLGALRDLTSWCLGDWINVGEALYGELVAQGVEVTGRSKVTLLEYARVARQVPHSRRCAGLSFSHHQLVAGKEASEQDEWLNRAEANRWSIEEMRGALRDSALTTRPTTRRSTVEVLELVEDTSPGRFSARQSRSETATRASQTPSSTALRTLSVRSVTARR